LRNCNWKYLILTVNSPFWKSDKCFGKVWV
jgi:hypothetical protein